MVDRESAYGGGGGASNCRKKVKICSDEQPLFFGSSAMVNFGGVGGSSNSFYQFFDPQENGDEHLDDYFNQPDKKKKRLSVDQVSRMRINSNQKGKFSLLMNLVCSLVKLPYGFKTVGPVQRQSSSKQSMKRYTLAIRP